MPINPSENVFFEWLQSNKKNPSTTDAQSIRDSMKILDRFIDTPANIKFEDIKLSCRDGHNIRLRYYFKDESIKPIIIFFPGNGFVYDLFEANHSFVSKIAKQSGCHALLVDYRLAPEYPYPDALNDATESFEYIIHNHQFFHADNNKIIIAGLSSGANLAAVLTNKYRDKSLIFHQFLISGGYDYTNSLHEYDKFGLQDKLLSPAEIQFSFNNYCKESERKLPTCSPYWENDLKGLPPTTILVAEYDGGRSQSEGYAQKLIQAGNIVTKHILPGQTHGTILYRKALSDGRDPASVAAELIRKIVK